MSDHEANDLRLTAKFIHQASEEREIKLDVLNTLSELVSATENLLKKPDPGEDIKINGDRKKSRGKTPRYMIKDSSQNGLKLTICRI